MGEDEGTWRGTTILTGMNNVVQYCQQCCSAMITMLLQHCSAINVVITCETTRDKEGRCGTRRDKEEHSGTKWDNHINRREQCCTALREQYNIETTYTE